MANLPEPNGVALDLPTLDADPSGTAESRLARLIDGPDSPWGAYECDSRGRFVFVSDRAGTLLGATPLTLIGKTWSDISAGERGHPSGPNEPFACEVIGTDGLRRRVEVFPHPRPETHDEPLGVDGLIRLAPQAVGPIDSNGEEPGGGPTAALRRRLAFEDLLVSLSKGFINLPVEQIDAGMQQAIREIGEFTGIDRGFIFEFDPTTGNASVAHKWSASERPGPSDNGASTEPIALDDSRPDGQLAWSADWLAGEEARFVDNLGTLPTAAKPLADRLDSLGVRSAVLAPMVSAGRPIGLLVLGNTGPSTGWCGDDLGLIQVLAEVLVNVLDRHRAERSLRESESRYRAIVEDQIDLIVRWRPDGVQTFVNDAVCRLLGRDADAVLGANVFDGIHPDDLPVVKAKLAALTPDKPFAADQHRSRARDGVGYVWMQWIDRAMFDEHGNAIEYQSIGRDITELRQAQETLREKLELERQLLEVSLGLINLPGGEVGPGVTEALKRIGQFTGVERCAVYARDRSPGGADAGYHWSSTNAPQWCDEVCGPLCQALTPPAGVDELHAPSLDELPGWIAQGADSLRAAGVHSLVSVPLKVDGEVIGCLASATYNHAKRWTDDELSLMRLSAGVLVNFLLRAAAERDLRLSEERLRLAIESADGGMFDLDIPSGRVFLSNQLLPACGLPEGKNLQHLDAWRRRIHQLDLPRVDQALARHTEGESESFDVEYRRDTPDGKTQWRQARGRVVSRSADGQPTRLLGVDRDVTWRVREQQKNRELEDQLAHLGRLAAMGEAVAGLAHEVNQPLHAAATFAAAAGRALTSDREGAGSRATELIQKTGDQVARAGDIIHRLREFTRRQPITFKLLDLSVVVRESAALVSHVTRRQDVRVELDLAEGLPPVRGDMVQLQQVVVNLIQNACDALKGEPPTPPVIRLTTWADGDRTLASVGDNGPDCSGVDLDRIFDPFFTTKAEGMGIGLTLCRTIIESHRGRLWAKRNESGGGMTLLVELPNSTDGDSIAGKATTPNDAST